MKKVNTIAKIVPCNNIQIYNGNRLARQYNSIDKAFNENNTVIGLRYGDSFLTDFCIIYNERRKELLHD